MKKKNKKLEEEAETIKMKADGEEGTDSATAEAPVELTPEDKITELEDELGRARARYQDFRRQAERQQQRDRAFISRDIWAQFLPLLDHFGSALSALDRGQNADQVIVGVKMIHQMMGKLLEDNGVLVIPTENRPFDPTLHEAVERVESDQHDPHMIVDEIQKGYRMGELVVRAARVSVAVDASEASESDGEDAPQDGAAE